MSRLRGIALLIVFMLGSVTSYGQTPSLKQLSGKWKHEFPDRTTYVVIKHVGQGTIGVQVFGIRNGGEDCQPTRWSSVTWTGKKIRFEGGTEWTPTYDSNSGTLRIAFDGGSEVQYKPARLYPKKICGYEGEGVGV